MRVVIRFFAGLLALVILSGLAAQPASAHGGWRWGVGIGVGLAPAYVPGPYYYPPPAYYPPPPVYYAPPPPPPGYYSPYPGFIEQSPPPAQAAPVQNAGGAAESCNAGRYVCPMEVSVPVGARCYCRGNEGARVYGSAQ